LATPWQRKITALQAAATTLCSPCGSATVDRARSQRGKLPCLNLFREHAVMAMTT